ncbi:MAG: VOC family protein [Actinomycetes bacterium]
MSENAESVMLGIDHVQLAIPVGGEPKARSFFVDLLGFEEIPKPERLAVRGGCWFRSGSVEIHVGVEEPFVAARKAHVALRVAGYDALRNVLESAGIAMTENDEIPGLRRSHVTDPFGNRLELMSADG